jgi:hypothetical protein
MLPVNYWVDGVESNECPVCLITPRNFELVQIFVAAAKVREETGTIMDLSQSPGWLYDAARLVQDQKIRSEVARQKAVGKLT